jgi:hypothetical protein
MAPCVQGWSGMGIDDPSMKGGTDPQRRVLPPGDTTDDTGDLGEPKAAEPKAAELDLPGPEDPVAWTYIKPGTAVTGREGVRIGSVEGMLGTEAEGIFHGIALRPAAGGRMRMIAADSVTSLTPAEVQVRTGADEVEGLPEYDEPG